MLPSAKRRTVSIPKSYCEDIDSSSSVIPRGDCKKIVTKNKWSKAEDKKLKSIVHIHGKTDWNYIATFLPNRTAIQCNERWNKSLNPDLVKGHWTKEEDEKIFELVQENGTKNWSRIAEHLKGRIAKQVRERWHNHLDPSVNKTAWTPKEEELIIHYQKLLGNQWSKIARMLPGRTDNAIKNFWNCSLRKKCHASDSMKTKEKKKVVEHSKVTTKSKRPASFPASKLPGNQSFISLSSDDEAPVVSRPESDVNNFSLNPVEAGPAFLGEEVQSAPFRSTVPFPESTLSSLPQPKIASVSSVEVPESPLSSLPQPKIASVSSVKVKDEFSVELLPENIDVLLISDNVNLNLTSTNKSGSTCDLPMSELVKGNEMNIPDTPEENSVETPGYIGCLASMVESLGEQRLSVCPNSSVKRRSFDRINTQKKTVKLSSSKAEESVVCAMKIIYFLAKEDLATQKFGPLKDFLIDFGCSSPPGITVNSNTSFESYDSFGDMDTALASMIQEKILKQIKAARWFSIVIDECTDISVGQNVIIFVKFFNEGKVVTHYLCLAEIEGVSAEQIFVCVAKTFEKLGIDISKCSSTAIDGPSVMRSVRGEVAALFRKRNPHLVSVHRVAHRVSLALTQVADEFPYLIKYQDILKRFHSYFEKSLAKTNRLHHIQRVLSLTNGKLLKLSAIRWLSLGNSVLNVDTSWSGLVSVLSEDNGPESQGLLKHLTSYMFLATTAMLNDVVFCVSKLIKAFQKKNLDFEFAQSSVNACIGNLKSMKNKTGSCFMDFEAKTLIEDARKTTVYEAHFVTDSIDQRKQFEALMDRFLTSIIEHIEDILGDMDKMEIFNIFLPRNLPNDPSELDMYGKEEIFKISQMFSSSVNFDELEFLSEWTSFKVTMQEKLKGMTVQEVLEYLFTNNMSEEYPLICSVIEFALTIPLHTADCEKGFNALNLIKMNFQNRMNSHFVNNILMIKLEGPDRKKFNFNQAFEKWAQQL